MSSQSTSKLLSYWLRHQPEAGGLTLDANGWTSTSSLLDALQRHGAPHALDDLRALVESSDKKRFELSPDESRIRARQGHSVTVEGDWSPATPPDILFHGTPTRFLPAILVEGLKPMKRHHVHLSADIETASAVGARRGDTAVLEIDCRAMVAAGHVFLVTGNGVWLTHNVPPEAIRVRDDLA